MDVDPVTLDLVKSGVIDSTIAQKPYTMTYFGLKALDMLHHNPVPLDKDYSTDAFSPFPSFVDTGTSLVDKNNVELFIQSSQAAQSK